jgi:hypothetical protein
MKDRSMQSVLIELGAKPVTDAAHGVPRLFNKVRSRPR